MEMKLIMAFVNEEKATLVMDAARQAGATGATIISSARGEGIKPEKTFLGLDLSAQCDVLLFLVAAAKSREILETIATVGRFDEEPGSGMAVQMDIEDAVGLKSQIPTLLHEIEEEV